MASVKSAPVELGNKPLRSLLKEYAVPGIIAMTASSLYNVIDSIYIGHIRDVGSYAISGLAVTFPLMNLSAALGTLVGVGAMTMISVLLGQKNYEDANKILGNVFSLNVIISILFTIFTLSFLEPILRFFGASDKTLPFARDYMFVILLGNVITHLYFGFNGLIRASGHPRLAMRLTLFTVISNAILDPIFIFVLDMGIRGAAIATILCQFLAFCYTMKFFMNRERFVHFPTPVFQLDWKVAKSSMAIGMGPFLMNAAACIVALFINQQLRKYGGDLAIGSFGIVNRFIMMFAMVNMGINQGMQPIAGYNFGARQYARVRKIFHLTAACAICVTMTCFLIAEFLPGPAVRLFTNDPELEALAIKGLRLANSGFALVGFGMVATSFFQSLGMVKKSVFLSLSRQLLFLVPLLYSLPLWLGEKGVWISLPISDTINLVVSAIMIHSLFKKLRMLKDGDSPDILGSQLK